MMTQRAGSVDDASMLTTTFTIRTALPPDAAFAYVSDFGHQPEWRHDVLTSELDHGVPGEAGSMWRQEIRPGRLPRPHQRLVEMNVAEPYHAVAYRTVDDAPIRAEGSYTLDGDATGTTISITTTLNAVGPAGTVALLAIRRHFKVTTDRYREQLAQALDGHPLNHAA
jgi:Polyketide cyclase / dehydrase and lipid transport